MGLDHDHVDFHEYSLVVDEGTVSKPCCGRPVANGRAVDADAGLEEPHARGWEAT